MKWLIILCVIFGCMSLNGQNKDIVNLYESIKILDIGKIEKYSKKIGDLSNVSLNNEPPLNFLFYTYREYFPDRGIEAIEILVKYKANPNSVYQGAYGSLSYALEGACHGGNPKAVKRLIELGADVKKGYPLHIAAVHRRLEIVQLLVEDYGLNVNAIDDLGKTPLINSVLFFDKSNISLPVVKYLIEKGADRNFTTEKGETALDLAIKNKNNPVIDYLKKLGVKQNIPVEISKEKPCPRCNASGLEPLTVVYRDCNWCGGKGYKEIADEVVGAGQVVKFYSKRVCTSCDGKGKVYSHTEQPRCQYCGGKKYVKE